MAVSCELCLWAVRWASSPNFIFVISAVIILTSIRKWEQSEMFREYTNRCAKLFLQIYAYHLRSILHISILTYNNVTLTEKKKGLLSFFILERLFRLLLYGYIFSWCTYKKKNFLYICCVWIEDIQRIIYYIKVRT